MKLALVHDWLTGMRGGEKALEVLCERFPDAELFTLVHDWLTGMRGGEKVLDAICELFPDAPLFTLVRVPGSVSARIEHRPIHCSFVQSLPNPGRFYRHYLPLYPLAVAASHRARRRSTGRSR